MIVDLHFVCPQGRNHRQLGQMTFETGNWVVSDERANEAIGGRIYLHEQQDSRAWHGGTIVGWRPFDDKRKVFNYRVEGDFRILCPGPWGQEQATVRRED